MRIIIMLLLVQLSTIVCGQKVVVLNNYNKNDVDFFIGLEKSTESFNYLQAAQKFKCEASGGSLQKINVRRLILNPHQGYVNADSSSSTTFVLRVYDVDSLTGGPGRDLSSQILKVKNKKDRVVSLDLRKYNIIVPRTEFFVAVEWLIIADNKRMVERRKLEFSFQTITTSYQPFIGMINSGSKESNAWVLTPEMKWQLYTHNMPYMTDLAISAEVKY